MGDSWEGCQPELAHTLHASFCLSVLQLIGFSGCLQGLEVGCEPERVCLMRQPAALSKDISSGWDLSSSQQEVEVALPRESVFCPPLPHSFHCSNPGSQRPLLFSQPSGLITVSLLLVT